jgi:hypothetical protein
LPTSSPLTTLAGGTVNGTDTTITVELIRPVHMPAVDRTLHPAVVRIVSPLQSTIVDPKHSPEMAAMLTTLFAEAATTLAPNQSPEAAVTAPQPTRGHTAGCGKS